MQCCVPQCGTSTETDHHLRFYNVPGDEERIKVWLKNMKYDESWPLWKPLIVCSLHFRGGKLSVEGNNPTIFPWSEEWSAVTANNFKRKSEREFNNRKKCSKTSETYHKPSSSQQSNTSPQSLARRPPPVQKTYPPSVKKTYKMYRVPIVRVIQPRPQIVPPVGDHDYCKVSSLCYMNELLGQWKEFDLNKSVLSCMTQYNEQQQKHGLGNSPSSVSSSPGEIIDNGISSVREETDDDDDDDDDDDEDPADLLATGKVTQLMKALRKYRKKNKISSASSEEPQSLPEEKQQYDCLCGRFTTTNWTSIVEHQKICTSQDSRSPDAIDTTLKVGVQDVLPSQPQEGQATMADEHLGDELDEPLYLFGWSRTATLLLIESFRNHKDDCEDHTDEKNVVWKNVARALQDQGYAVDDDLCRSKMEALKNRYKTIKDRTTTTTEYNALRPWQFFHAMDELMAGDPAVQPIVLKDSLPFASTSSASAATERASSSLTSAQEQPSIPIVSPPTTGVLNSSPSPSPVLSCSEPAHLSPSPTPVLSRSEPAHVYPSPNPVLSRSEPAHLSPSPSPVLFRSEPAHVYPSPSPVLSRSEPAHPSPTPSPVLSCSEPAHVYPSPNPVLFRSEPPSAFEDTTTHSSMEHCPKRQKVEGVSIIGHALLQSQDKMFYELVQISKEWNTSLKELSSTLQGKSASHKAIEQCQREKEELQQKYHELCGLLLQEKDKHMKQIQEMRENNFKEIKEMILKHNGELNALQDQHQEQLMEIKFGTYAEV